MQLPTPLLVGLVAVSLSTGTAFAQATWRVPGDKATIAEAVAAAVDGDRILLTQSATAYAVGNDGLTLAKSLVIETVGSARATVRYPDGDLAKNAALKITGFGAAVGAARRIVVRNVDFVGGYSPFTSSAVRPAVIDVQLSTSTRGELVLDGVKTVGEIRHVDGSCRGLNVETSSVVRVVLRQCRFEGASGRSPLFSSGEIEYLGSVGGRIAALGPILVEDTTFVGGNGGRASWANFGPFWTARDGGKGLVMSAPLGAIVNSVAIEGDGGSVIVEPSASGYPDPCASWGFPGDSSIDADVFHCVRRVVPRGCNQTFKDWPLNIGRRDLEVGSPKEVGQNFRIKAGSLQAGQGISALLFGVGTDTRTVTGIEGKFYLDIWISLGVVPPSLPYSWTDIWFAPPPAGLPWVSTFAMQLVHLDAAFTRTWFGSPATFTVSSR